MVWLNRHPFELLGDLDRVAAAAAGRMARAAWPETRVDTPRANVHVGEDEAGLELLVPGFGPEHVEVSIERDVVLVKGERRADTEDDSDAEPQVEDSFERRFKLPFDIDADAVEARLLHGVLRLTLPKLGRQEARRIEVQ